jgi:hypothetical protein
MMLILFSYKYNFVMIRGQIKFLPAYNIVLFMIKQDGSDIKSKNIKIKEVGIVLSAWFMDAQLGVGSSNRI